MRLTLDPTDLDRKFQTNDGKGNVDQAIPTGEISFDKLNAAAQKAVTVVGSATYYGRDERNYTAVHPPAKPKEGDQQPAGQ